MLSGQEYGKEKEGQGMVKKGKGIRVSLVRPDYSPWLLLVSSK